MALLLVGAPTDAMTVDSFVTISAGVACLGPDTDISAPALIAAADRALYSAKERGRNRVEISAGLRGTDVLN